MLWVFTVIQNTEQRSFFTTLKSNCLGVQNERNNRIGNGEQWDIVFATDMLNLAEFRGMVHPDVHRLPHVLYFHENQLTYPVFHAKEYDYHFAFSNMTTALASREVWFNSVFHRDAFLGELDRFLRRMPDHQPLDAVASIREKARVCHPCIEEFPDRVVRPEGPMHVLWLARWELDKDPVDARVLVHLLHLSNELFLASVGVQPVVVGEEADICAGLLFGRYIRL